MEFSRNRATDRRPEGDRVLDASFVLVDTTSVETNLLHEKEIQNNGKSGYTVFKSDKLAIVLVMLDEGNSILPGKTSGTMVLQVLQGQLDVKVAEQSVELEPMRILVIRPDMDCEIHAAKDSRFYLFNAIE
ncbi:MAG: hypothetical protein NVV59_12395 [Chitinophagaceae bacterium]|nr:hypothetical protein [Chitinophagaceae bacterium]